MNVIKLNTEIKFKLKKTHQCVHFSSGWYDFLATLELNRKLTIFFVSCSFPRLHILTWTFNKQMIATEILRLKIPEKHRTHSMYPYVTDRFYFIDYFKVWLIFFFYLKFENSFWLLFCSFVFYEVECESVCFKIWCDTYKKKTLKRYNEIKKSCFWHLICVAVCLLCFGKRNTENVSFFFVSKNMWNLLLRLFF